MIKGPFEKWGVIDNDGNFGNLKLQHLTDAIF